MLFLYNFSFLQCYHFLIQVFQNFFQKALFREKSYGPLLQNISKKLLLKPPKTFFLVFFALHHQFLSILCKFQIMTLWHPCGPFLLFFLPLFGPFAAHGREGDHFAKFRKICFKYY